MSVREGAELLHAVAERILVGYLERRGERDVGIVDASQLGRLSGVDLVYHHPGGAAVGVKVKADAYQGSDAHLAADRALAFYRPAGDAFAFEAISDHRTRAPGWILNSRADELFYYRLAIAQPEREVSALMSEPDTVFFGELRVESDSLFILPMAETRRWFEANSERYAPRPVAVGDHATWVRLVPAKDIESAVPGVRSVGPVFSELAATPGVRPAAG